MAHFAKYTAAAAGHLSKHYERAKDEKGEYIKFGNKDIDTDRTPKIITLLPTVRRTAGVYQAEAFRSQVAKKGRCKDPLRLGGDTPKRGLYSRARKGIFCRNLSFFIGKVRRKNVVSAFVHKDEEQPHMHFAFIPG